MWEFIGKKRPSFATEPGEGQESVWDYPRPPACRPDSRRVIVRVGDLVIADSTEVIRILETASPPTVYIPQSDVNMELLVEAAGSSFCEWKGAAKYWSLQINEQMVKHVGWSYPDPQKLFASIKGFISFYPAKVDCFIDAS
jgi:uncharacterized protein (DUF427 family)